jgi:hypothetical protein
LWKIKGLENKGRGERLLWKLKAGNPEKDKGKLKKKKKKENVEKEGSKVNEYVNVEGIIFFVVLNLPLISLSMAQ